MSKTLYNPEDFKVAEENKKDFKLSVIERSNMTNSFTIKDIEESQKELQKMKKELESQKGLCEATCDNILRNHKKIGKLTAEEQHHTWMYFENKKVVDDAIAKLKEVDETLENYESISDIIYEVGGFEKGVKSDELISINLKDLEDGE